MTDEEVGREIAALERHERERDEGQRAIRAAACRHFGDRLAGIWVQDDQETVVVAVTGDRDHVAAELRTVAPVNLRVVVARHTLVELEALCGEVLAAADELDAPLAAIAVMEVENTVEVMLEDLRAPSSLALRERFQDQPIVWVEGTVYAA